MNARRISITLAYLAAFWAIALGAVAAATRPASGNGEAERFSQEIRRIFSTMKSTEYSHKTQVDEREGKYFLDCSGLPSYVLKHKFPQHFKVVPVAKGHSHPQAKHFCQFFRDLPSTPQGRNGWQRITRLLDAQPGDILAWESHDPKTGSTGHVVIIDGTPVRDTKGLVRVEIIDSTGHGHGNDTRKPGQTGIGRGTMWFSVNDQGEPTAYHWSSPRGKGTQHPIGMGRIVKIAAGK